MLFFEAQDHADIFDVDRNRAFTIMVTEQARQFYF